MENLGLDPKLIFSQIINFIVFFFIFSKFMAKPFHEYLKKQRAMEKERELLSEGLKKREEELANEKEKLLKETREEVNKMLAEAKQDGERIVADARDKAKEEADAVTAKAKEDIERMKADAEKEMQKQVVDTSMVLLNKGLRDYLNDDARKSITKYILDNSSKQLKA